MPSSDQHLRQAEANERFFSGIDQLDFPEWAVVALFYSALHYVDAHFGSRIPPWHPGSHSHRNSLVARHLIQIHPHYMELYDRSRDARYVLLRFSRADVKELEDVHFRRVRDHLRRTLGV